MLTAQQTFLTHQITSVILMFRNAFYDIPSIHRAEKKQIFFSLLNKGFKDVERFGCGWGGAGCRVFLNRESLVK